MKNTTSWLVVLVVVLLLCWVSGCGNVSLTGDALTAAQVSTMDAYDFWQRVDGNSQPLVKAYAQENVVQWRCFVRSALRNQSWGPELPGDPNE